MALRSDRSPLAGARALAAIARACCGWMVLTATLGLAPRAFAQSPAAEAKEAAPSEVLVFADGDRVRGRLIGRDGEFLVFQSVRFGELRVPAGDATIHPLQTPDAARTAAATEAATPVASAAAESASAATREGDVVSPDGAPGSIEMPGRGRPHWTSPAALAIALRDFLGPWEGRLALSASMLTDSKRNEDFSAELRFRRRWTRDEARFTLNYDFSRTDGARDTDRLKGNGVLRHDFRDRPLFVNYRPTVEWNREFRVDDRPADYVLLQQEIGLGVNLVRGEDRYRTFEHEPVPAADLQPDMVRLHKELTERNAKILYRGTPIKSYADSAAKGSFR